MQPISHAWCVQIDVTSYCVHSCLYCSRYNRHLRPDQRVHMPMDTFVRALHSLRDWPTNVGIIGGEPLLHPEFRTMNFLIRKSGIPGHKMGLWTSGLPGSILEDPRLDPDIDATYDRVYFNPHDQEQVKKCRHQPLTVAISEVVPDRDLMWKLIDDCWVQRDWCATITYKGAYFCEVAAAQDLLLNDGANAWPIEPGWWKRPIDSPDFRRQKEALCPNCGMAIPMEREFLLKKAEKFSPRLLEMFRSKNLKRMRDKDVELFSEIFTIERVRENIKQWYPGNYREDLIADECCGTGIGFKKDL